MPVLKTNLLFRNNVGFYLLTALLLITISFLIFVCNSISQKVVCILITAYFSFLLINKYTSGLKLLFLIVSLFVFMSFIHKREPLLQLNDETQILLYPDQIHVKDHYLTGIGYMDHHKVLISGKLSDSQVSILKMGSALLLSKIEGDCRLIEPATNIGEFNYQEYYAAKEIFQKIKFTSCDLHQKKANDLLAKLHQLRYYLQNYFQKMPQLISFFASELILGENNAQENQQILSNYRDLGVIHLLSISGLHVGLYVLIVSTICFSLKLTDEETFICCCGVLLLAIFLSYGQAGFIRASLTYFLSKICKFKGYHIAAIDVLGLACILHMIFVPRLFMMIGAILSYLLALGLQITDKFGKVQQSICLNLMLMPLLLFYFYQINLLTVVFNLMVVPYFNWVVIPVTFVNVLVFGLTRQLTPMSEQILTLGEKIIAKFSATKIGLVTFGQINWWQCLLLILLTILLLIAIREKPEWKINKKDLSWSLFLIYLLIFCTIHFPLQGQVTFIDVGQGDSILITTPFPRKVYLIDTGGKLNFTGKKTVPQINKITIPFLKSQGISSIDAIFVSHQDADHVGDLGPLLEQINVKRLFMAKGLINNPSFQRRLNGRIKQTKLVELIAGMQIKEPKITFNVVYPYQAGEGKNEDSLSLAFNLANKTWLFTGDLGQAGEKEIMQKSKLSVDYFKLGHHGSKTSSNPDFLRAIHPKLVFISAGRNNRFGHPHQETLTTLVNQHIPWVSTQDCGMISWYYGGIQGPKFNYFLKRRKR